MEISSEVAKQLESGLGGFEQFFEQLCHEFESEEDYYKVAFQIVEVLTPDLMNHMDLNPDDIDDDCIICIEQSLCKYADPSFPNIKSVCERLLEEGY